jgi:hypothetical protein
MNTLKNVACLANALGLLCFWHYVAAVLLAVLIGRRPEAFITEFVAHEDQKSDKFRHFKRRNTYSN